MEKIVFTLTTDEKQGVNVFCTVEGDAGKSYFKFSTPIDKPNSLNAIEVIADTIRLSVVDKICTLIKSLGGLCDVQNVKKAEE